MRGRSRPQHPRLALLVIALACPASSSAAPIDRQALVARHDPVVRSLDPDAPLTVGNGGFAFTVDATGLQSFSDLFHREGVPTETLSRWAWHSEANPRGFKLEDAQRAFTHPDGRVQGYPTDGGSPAGAWLRRNPHDLPLAVLGLDLRKADGTGLAAADVRAVEQRLDQWRGVIASGYELGGVRVAVTTAVHPELDLVAVRLESKLLAAGRLRVRLAFPRGHDLSVKNTPPLDWSAPESHVTRVLGRAAQRVDLERQRDTTRYRASIAWSGSALFQADAAHEFRLTGAPGARSLEFVVAFAPDALPVALPNVDETLAASGRAWERFWRQGAMVDFSGSSDPRASKLERRIVQSQYLTAVQLRGAVPPQESGLTCSTWYGKHHTEMIWWHTAHFALWGRDEFLADNLKWYVDRLPVAREVALGRGLRGARWPKMVGPEGRESPGGNPLILWNQPHPIALAELLYRNRSTTEVLERYRELVFETAEGLVSLLHLDPTRGRYVLGPPLWIAQEIYDQAHSQNPSFELAYWRYALEMAQLWRTRLGQQRSSVWDDALARLSPLPVKDGKYVALESHPDTFDNVDSRHDHPTMLAPLGLLPGGGVDRETMRRTLDAVLRTWDWETKIWGWDYPMIAMTAARLGDPQAAVEVLLRDGPNNRYLPNGHCPQRSDQARRPQDAATPRREIAAYLPANGALLSAVALMVAGWDGNEQPYPGFPRDGSWKIQAEGLHPLP